MTDPRLDPRFKQGNISSVKTIQDGLLRVFEVNAAVSAGMSGGPAVDLQGHIIGVNSFKPVGESQPFNFIRPSSLVPELMKDKGVRNEVGSANAAYRAGVQAYFRGDRTVALRKLGEVLDEVPSHALAQEYRWKARRLHIKEATGGALSSAIAMVWLAVLLAIASILVVARKRRTGAAQSAVMVPADASDDRGDTKLCPERAETIKAAARVCRYCGARVEEDPD